VQIGVVLLLSGDKGSVGVLRIGWEELFDRMRWGERRVGRVREESALLSLEKRVAGEAFTPGSRDVRRKK
jgi:hypothetical protein